MPQLLLEKRFLVRKQLVRTTLAVVVGAIIYRVVLALALRVDFVDTGDIKLITAVIVICALVLPQFIDKRREKRNREKRYSKRISELTLKREGTSVAKTEAD